MTRKRVAFRAVRGASIQRREQRLAGQLASRLLAAGVLATVIWAGPSAQADTVFLEAETFTSSSDGWTVAQSKMTRPASGTKTLWGATGDPAGIAEKQITIRAAGPHRIWVRRIFFDATRDRLGPFRVSILRDDRELAGAVFDTVDHGKRWKYVWDHLDADLPRGQVTLRLSKHENRNCTGNSRHVDCLLITDDFELEPNHLAYGVQTYLRVTLGEGYDRPVYVHVFADHYYAPWSDPYHISRDGIAKGVKPRQESLMHSGDRSPWLNISPLLYPSSGARLVMDARYSYQEPARGLRARFEFATAADEAAIVSRHDVERNAGGIVFLLPPDLATEEHRSRMTTDMVIARRMGAIADASHWPTVGKAPERFPFFVSTPLRPLDSELHDREWKTLGYFGFSNLKKGYEKCKIWYGENRSYCRPMIEKMTVRANQYAAAFREAGGGAETIAWMQLMDEPVGQDPAFMAACEGYRREFRAWLQVAGKIPADLLVDNWDAVVPVTPEQRTHLPALYYHTQIFRTRALGQFMELQKRIALDAYGGDYPVTVNFSGGAVYYANFYGQGVDYFELLDTDEQNAICGEDWMSGAATYQTGAYNVELMRAAARRRGQTLTHMLIAHANRKPFDIKLKCAAETARGVKAWRNFFYGPAWASHECGPHWRSHDWSSKPETWFANAEIVQEIGGAEDLLLDAMPAPSEVAILYSSASDIWTLQENRIYGFDRMYTWLALAHAQVPADVVWEKDVARNGLKGYKVCYLSGPNLTASCATQLAKWVTQGGILWLTAGAAERDEYNRPLSTLESILPVRRAAIATLEPFLGFGSGIASIPSHDCVRAGSTELEVLSIRQALQPNPGADVSARFSDGSPALVTGKVGAGRIYCLGFLPAVPYVKQAVAQRQAIEKPDKQTGEPARQPTPEEAVLLERSYNPWAYPHAIREFLLTPVRAVGIEPPVTCNVPLVDALLMTCETGAVLPLANYSLRPISHLELVVRTPRKVERAVSVHAGPLDVERIATNTVRMRLPLADTDFINFYYQ